jgi:hypothetical protein
LPIIVIVEGKEIDRSDGQSQNAEDPKAEIEAPESKAKFDRVLQRRKQSWPMV